LEFGGRQEFPIFVLKPVAGEIKKHEVRRPRFRKEIRQFGEDLAPRLFPASHSDFLEIQLGKAIRQQVQIGVHALERRQRLVVRHPDEKGAASLRLACGLRGDEGSKDESCHDGGKLRRYWAHGTSMRSPSGIFLRYSSCFCGP